MLKNVAVAVVSRLEAEFALQKGEQRIAKGVFKMKQVAKFSVIVPADHFSAEQIEIFETTAQRYGLPITLPLRADGYGNLIISQGMSLRDAQVLRRHISGLGYPADVVNDTSEPPRVSNAVSDTLVVDAIDADFETQDAVSDIAADAWSSLEMPSLDLGLFDGDESNDSSLPSSDGAKEEKTLSLSAMDLFKVAQAKRDGMATQEVSLADFKSLAEKVHQVEQLSEASSAHSVNVPLLSQKMPSKNLDSNLQISPHTVAPAQASQKPIATPNIPAPDLLTTVDAPSLDIDESSLCAHAKEDDTTQKPKDSQSSAISVSHHIDTGKDINTQSCEEFVQKKEPQIRHNDLPESDLTPSPSEKRSHAFVACALVVIVLLLAVVAIHTYVAPISVIQSLVQPLF